MDKIFELEEYDDKQVIVKVNAKDTLAVAKHPYVSSDIAYITVTRGTDHIFTVIKSDGKTFSFSFGSSGYTLISKDLEALEKAVLDFISKNGINIYYHGGKPSNADIFYNKNFEKWQLTIYVVASAPVYFWSDTATDIDSAIEAFKPYVTAEKWEKTKAMTGIDVWKAKKAEFYLK